MDKYITIDTINIEQLFSLYDTECVSFNCYLIKNTDNKEWICTRTLSANKFFIRKLGEIDENSTMSFCVKRTDLDKLKWIKRKVD